MLAIAPSSTVLFPPVLLWHNDETPLGCHPTALLTTHLTKGKTVADRNVIERVTVYKVTCLHDGRVYVGITVRTPPDRFRQHGDHAMSGRLDGPFHRAIRQHGRDGFLVETLFVAFSRRDAGWAEKLFVKQFDCVAPRGFNLTHGGEPDARWSDASRAKASASYKGRPWTDEKRAQMAITQQTPEYREKMRAASAKRTKQPVSDETREKLRQAAIKQFSDLAARQASSDRAQARMADPVRRKALSETALDNWSKPDYREKHKAAMKVVVANPEYLQNVGAATSRRMADPANREVISKAVKLRFADPEFRANARKALLASPKFQSNRSMMALTNSKFGHLVPGFNAKKDNK